ncbi:MAG: alanine racemase [Microbacteriaceae bacterium]|nr:alanine racemase [Microbacteriaceae bacterium]
MSTPLRRLYVSASAITANVERLRELAPARDTMVVVKANGYGHGAELSARAALAGGATWIGVADIDEALFLRTAGIDAPILAWLHAVDDDFGSAVRASVAIGVSTLNQLERVAAVGGASVHLKVDTGLGRNGMGRSGLAEFIERAVDAHHRGDLRIDGLMSHVSGASREADLGQAERFVHAQELLAAHGVTPTHLHLAASAAALDHPSLRFTMVRFGVAAFGLAPTPEHSDLGLTPAMRFEASVINIKRLQPGDGVSYNLRWVASTETTVALVSAGYADGVPRAATGRAQVEIRGKRYPVVGTIAMDQFVVDVGDDVVTEGDAVGLWGDPQGGTPSVADWAEWADTITYDIATGIGSRVARFEQS